MKPVKEAVMRGAEVLLDCLKREGVDVIFGISGGAILPSAPVIARNEELLVLALSF